MYTLVIGSDPNTNSQIAHVRVQVLKYAQQEGKRRGGPRHTWCGGFPPPAKGPKKTWAAGRRAAAVALAVAQAKRTGGGKTANKCERRRVVLRKQIPVTFFRLQCRTACRAYLIH